MSCRWDALSWSHAALGRALFELGRASGLQPWAAGAREASAPPAGGLPALDDWIETGAETLGMRAEPLAFRRSELSAVLARSGPGLICIPGAGEIRYLMVVRSSTRKLTLVTPSLVRATVPLRAVRELLAGPLGGEQHDQLEWLSGARIHPRRLSRARAALADTMFGDTVLGGVWQLELDPGRSFSAQLRHHGLLGRAAAAITLAAFQVAVSAAGWYVLGSAALRGVFEPSWLSAWLLAAATALALQIATAWLGSTALTETARLFKQRMLAGALRLAPDRIRTQGAGRLLAMVAESEAIEAAGLSGAFGAALSLVQLGGAFVVLALGAGGLLHVLTLLAWCAFLAMLARSFARRRSAWTQARFALARSFVEHALGNRTRVAQQRASHWHREEDRALAGYLQRSTSMDALQRLLFALPGRGFLVLALLGLVPALLSGATTPAAISIAIGGSLQAHVALSGLGAHLTALTSAFVAWRQVGELFRAAAAAPSGRAGGVLLPLPLSPPAPGSVVLEARALSFGYAASRRPVLRDCTLVLHHGDRVLLEGPSGGGKSTLASLLVGLQQPGTGFILARGLDRASLGNAAWRRRVASAPQFHENHVFANTLAFNLLMGRSWPPSQADRHEADALCRALGLGPLLDAMPGGLNQIVGESGWQLSHGERSRIFLARALLQHADVVVLDESFGALDPHSLRTCVHVALERAPVLVVISHA